MPPKFTKEELEHSKRIYKSATPKQDASWYVKWIASFFILCGMSIRGVDGYAFYDVTFSLIGVSLWSIVSIIWNDRALILLNGIGVALLLRTIIEMI